MTRRGCGRQDSRHICSFSDTANTNLCAGSYAAAAAAVAAAVAAAAANTAVVHLLASETFCEGNASDFLSSPAGRRKERNNYCAPLLLSSPAFMLHSSSSLSQASPKA